MLISVKAVRDRDRVVLGEAVFEVNDKQMGRKAIADLIEHLYASGRDLLKLSPFTFVFEKVDAPPRPRSRRRPRKKPRRSPEAASARVAFFADPAAARLALLKMAGRADSFH